jgi:hypothetical protein
MASWSPGAVIDAEAVIWNGDHLEFDLAASPRMVDPPMVEPEHAEGSANHP